MIAFKIKKQKSIYPSRKACKDSRPAKTILQKEHYPGDT